MGWWIQFHRPNMPAEQMPKDCPFMRHSPPQAVEMALTKANPQRNSTTDSVKQSVTDCLRPWRLQPSGLFFLGPRTTGNSVIRGPDLFEVAPRPDIGPAYGPCRAWCSQ
jgi:hypothetical protein